MFAYIYIKFILYSSLQDRQAAAKFRWVIVGIMRVPYRTCGYKHVFNKKYRVFYIRAVRKSKKALYNRNFNLFLFINAGN